MIHKSGTVILMSTPRSRAFLGRVSAFAVIGVLCTLAWLALYLVFRLVMPPLAANALSLVVTTVANTAANRRFTYNVVGADGALRHQLEGGVVFLVGLALSSGGLGLVHSLVPGASPAVEIGAMLGSYGLATVVRFVLLDGWVFNTKRNAPWKQPLMEAPETQEAQ